eukprot:COSAG02_NODE_1167_length_14137_cov_25.567175_11_plen_284_part_00
MRPWGATVTTHTRRCVPRDSVISTDRCASKGASCRRERVGGRDRPGHGAIRVWRCTRPEQRRPASGSIGLSRMRSGLSVQCPPWRLWLAAGASQPASTDATLSRARTQPASRTYRTHHQMMRQRSRSYLYYLHLGVRRSVCQTSPGACMSCRRTAQGAFNRMRISLEKLVARRWCRCFHTLVQLLSVLSQLLPGAGISVDESQHVSVARRGARSLQPLANAPMATEQQASFVLPSNYVENHQYFQGNQSTVFRRGIKAPHYDLTHYMNAAVRKNVNIKSTAHD